MPICFCSDANFPAMGPIKENLWFAESRLHLVSALQCYMLESNLWFDAWGWGFGACMLIQALHFSMCYLLKREEKVGFNRSVLDKWVTVTNSVSDWLFFPQAGWVLTNQSRGHSHSFSKYYKRGLLFSIANCILKESCILICLCFPIVHGWNTCIISEETWHFSDDYI